MSQANEAQFIGIGGGDGGSKAPDAADTIESQDAKITLEGDSNTESEPDANQPRTEVIEGTEEQKAPSFSDFLNRNLDKEEVAQKEAAAKDKLLKDQANRQDNKTTDPKLVADTQPLSKDAAKAQAYSKDYT